MEPLNSQLSVVVYDTAPAKAEDTARRLTQLGHLVPTSTATRPLFHQAIRRQTPDLVVIGKGSRDHAAINVVRSVAEIEVLPTVVVIDSFDHVSGELRTHPAMSLVHRMASKAELEMRIGEARVRCQAHGEHIARTDRLRERLEHEPEIAQAKIRLMDQYGLSEEKAYAMLRTSSQNRRMRLEEVAQLVLSDGVQVVSELNDERPSPSRRP